MFSLKVASSENRISKVKVCIDLSPEEDSLAERTAPLGEASSHGEGKPADGNSTSISGSNAGMVSKTESMDKLYELEMNEKGSRLSFTWAVNPKKKKMKRKPAESPLKRARTNNFSSSMSSYEPSRPAGGGKLKLFNTPENQRIDGVNEMEEGENEEELQEEDEEEEEEGEEEEDAEEEVGFDSASKPALKIRVIENTAGVQHATEKREERSSNAEDSPKDNNPEAHTRDIPPDHVQRQNSNMICSGEYLAYKNDSSAGHELRSAQSGMKIEAQSRFPSGAILLRNKEPEQVPDTAAPASKTQEMATQEKRKRKAVIAANAEICDFRTYIYKAVKDEVRSEENKNSSFRLGLIACNDGFRPESKDLILMGSTSQAVMRPKIMAEPNIQHERGNPVNVHDGDSLKQESLPFYGHKEERDDHMNPPKLVYLPKVESASGSTPRNTQDVQLLVVDTGNSLAEETARLHNLVQRDDYSQDKVDNLVEGRFSSEYKATNELNLTVPDFEHLHSSAPDAVNHKTGPSKAHASDEENRLAFVVTEEELMGTLIHHGRSIKVINLVDKYSHRLYTTEAQEAFLQLLKRNCQPEEKNGELYVARSTF